MRLGWIELQLYGSVYLAYEVPCIQSLVFQKRMCVCVECLSVCKYVYACVCMCVFEHVRVCVYMSLCASVCVNVLMCELLCFSLYWCPIFMTLLNQVFLIHTSNWFPKLFIDFNFHHILLINLSWEAFANLFII